MEVADPDCGMLDIQRYPPVLDALLRHASLPTLAALSMLSRYWYSQTRRAIYTYICIRASQLPLLFSGSTHAGLKHVERLSILGKLPLSKSFPVDTLEAAILTSSMPQLRHVKWLPDQRDPVIARVRDGHAEEPIDGRWIHWQRTYRLVSALPCRNLLVRGSFAILQCTYADFHLERYKPDKKITFYIDLAGDFSSDCPVALWGGLGAHSASKRPMTIALAPHLVQSSVSSPGARPYGADSTVRFPVHSALLDRLAYMVHMDLIHLTLLGFPQRADHRHGYRAEIELDAAGGIRQSRLKLEDLADCLLFKLWNIYTIGEGDDRLSFVGWGDEELDG